MRKNGSSPIRDCMSDSIVNNAIMVVVVPKSHAHL